MYNKDRNTWMIQATILIVREESMRSYADHRTKYYLQGRIIQLHEVLDEKGYIPSEVLKSAHHLISHITSAHEEAYDMDDKGGALYQAVLRDLRDELETAIEHAGRTEKARASVPDGVEVFGSLD
jgi:hypothetical protein